MSGGETAVDVGRRRVRGKQWVIRSGPAEQREVPRASVRAEMLRYAHDRGGNQRGDRGVEQRLAMRSKRSRLPRDPARDCYTEQRDSGYGARHASPVVQNGFQQPLIGQWKSASHVVEEPARYVQVETSVAEAQGERNRAGCERHGLVQQNTPSVPAAIEVEKSHRSHTRRSGVLDRRELLPAARCHEVEASVVQRRLDVED